MQSSVTEKAAVDGDVSTTVEVDSVSAGGLFVVVRDLETCLSHEYAVAVVEMQIPELRIPERDALDPHSARTFDKRQTGAGNAEVREVPRVGRRVAQLPEKVPNGAARPVECSLTGDLQAIAVLRVDQGRVELFLEVTFDPGALDGKIGHVCRAPEHRTGTKVKVHLRLEEEGAAHEDASRYDDRSSTACRELVDRSLNGPGVDRGTISYRPEVSDRGFRRSFCAG
jgi:hypothetical protein